MRNLLVPTSLALCTALAAQGPIEKLDALLLPEIESRLASDDAADVAWGGYLVRQYRLRKASRAVLAALERWRHGDDDESRIVRLHLLDGLAGSGAVVPAEALEVHLGDAMTRDVAFALLAQEPAANFAQLERLAVEPAPLRDLARIGAARLLVQGNLRSTELGKHVLEHLSPSFHVVVDDNYEDQWSSMVGPGGGGRRVRRIRGFPPLIKWRLTLWANSTDVERLVVPQRGDVRAILLQREENATLSGSELDLGQPEELSEDELTLLVEMMGNCEIEQDVTLRLRWSGPEAFLAEVVARRDAQRAGLDTALAKLRERGWLGADDLPDFRIPLLEKVNDLRADKSVPLPQLPPPPDSGR